MTRRGEFMWGGLATCLCTRCGQLFTSADAFDRHYRVNQTTGAMTCFDPASMRRLDGGPAFERVDKPKWRPPYAWTRASPSRGTLPFGAST